MTFSEIWKLYHLFNYLYIKLIIAYLSEFTSSVLRVFFLHVGISVGGTSYSIMNSTAHHHVPSTQSSSTENQHIPSAQTISTNYQHRSPNQTISTNKPHKPAVHDTCTYSQHMHDICTYHQHRLYTQTSNTD